MATKVSPDCSNDIEHISKHVQLVIHDFFKQLRNYRKATNRSIVPFSKSAIVFSLIDRNNVCIKSIGWEEVRCRRYRRIVTCQSRPILHFLLFLWCVFQESCTSTMSDLRF